MEEKVQAKKESAAPKGGKKEGKVTNQFNFCERASQTFNNAVRVRGRGATDLHSPLLVHLLVNLSKLKSSFTDSRMMVPGLY